MKKEDLSAIQDFREMYGNKAADALVQYLTKKRKDLTASEVLEDDGAFERFSNWAYTKLGIDVYEKFAKHDVGGFFKRTNVEDFRKMRPGVDPNYNHFLRGIDNESKDVHESSDDISELNDREIAKIIADKFEEITGTPVSDIFNTVSDDPIFDQEMVDKTFPSIKKWLDDHGIFKNRQDDVLYELDDVLSSNHIGESIKPNDKITLTLGQIKKMIKEYKSLNEKTKESMANKIDESSDIDVIRDIMNELRKDESIQSIVSGVVGERLIWSAVNFFDEHPDSNYKLINYEVDSELKYDDDFRNDVCRLYQAIQEKMSSMTSVQKNESTCSLSRLDNVIVETSDATDLQTYWNGNGKYQDIANRLSGVSVEDLIEKFKIPYATASKFDRDRYQYYRFFNDGDTPALFKKDIMDKFGEFPKYCDIHNDDLFNFVAPRLEALIDADLSLVKPFIGKVPMEDSSIEENAVLKKQLIIGDNNDGTITIMLTSQPSEDDKKMLRTLAGDEKIDFKKDPEYSYWYASIKGKTPKEADEFISNNFSDYAVEIDKDQDQIA